MLQQAKVGCERTTNPNTCNSQAAGIPRKLAATIGISVDPRRQNLSEESLSANVARLKEYSARLILFPRKAGKAKKGDASAEDVKAVTENFAPKSKTAFPIANATEVTEGKLSDYQGEEGAYKKLREARSEARLIGVRAKRAKVKADADSDKK